MNLSKLFLSIALIILLLCACSNQDTSLTSTEDYITAAEAEIDAGNYGSAANILEEGLLKLGYQPELSTLLIQVNERKNGIQPSSSETEAPPSESELITTEAPTQAALISVNVSDAYNNGSSQIPQIELPYDSITLLNNEIYNDLLPAIEEAFFSYNYEWYQNDDILSLVIIGQGDSMQFHQVYNILLTDGTLLDNEDILDRLNWSEADFFSAMESSVGAFFDETYAWAVNDPYYNTVRSRSLDEQNLREAKLYFGKDCTLFASVYIGCFVGPDGMDMLIEIH